MKPHNLDPQTLEMLVCPLTKTRLTLNNEGTELVSVAARMAYPIRQGVSMLCLEEARSLTDEEIAALRHGKPD